MRKMSALALLLLCFSTVAAQDSKKPNVLDAVTVGFELLDRDGERVSIEAFRGQNVLLAFGFTHCAHICPMIAANMARSIKAAEKAAVGVFISVDTERDSPSVTDDYALKFGDNMVGLSGSYEQVSAAAKNFNVTFVVTKSEDNYTVQHTPSIFLIGPDGSLIDVFTMSTASREIAAAML
ncbi:MAG: SCO family protein [Gammaproteobacteria bacterium]|nr:SCO family protein [Gammaproteobacteria bacterium]